MATIILSALGQHFGGPIGSTIGALIGRQIDLQIFKPADREGPRLSELKVTSSSYGMPMPRHFGTMRVPGQIIWSTDLAEHRERQSNGKGNPGTVNYSYSASFAVALSSRPLVSVGRIWADGKLLRGAAGDLKVGGTFRLHPGVGNQAPDPLLAAAEGVARCPAYRGLAYAVFEDLQLSEFGNRIPTLSFEIVADTAVIGLARLLDGVIEDFDANLALTGLSGLSNEGPLADLLAALDPLYPVDCDACDERLVIRPDRLQSNAIALPEAATSARREDFGGNAGFARKRAAETEQPVAVLRYYDFDRDFQPGAQRATGRPLPGQPRTLELPATLTAQSARDLVEAAAQRTHWARQTVSWRVSQLDPAVRPGTIVTLPGHPGRWRIDTWEWNESGIDLQLSRLAPQSSGAFAADPGRASQAPDLAPATTLLAACELPWDGNPATAVPQLLAAASSAGKAWKGASLYVDQGDGALQFLTATGRQRATIGHAASVLPPANPLFFDRHSQVEVILAADDLMLVDATMRQLAMGANRAVLGREIIQFARAAPLGAGRWRLSGLWRARGATESAVSGHAMAEAFVLLDGGGVTLDPVAVSTVPSATLAAIGLADAAPVVAPIALRGIGHRPLSPVHGWLRHSSDGSLTLGWTRRARGGWSWNDGADLPLNEQVESYTVSYRAGITSLATWDTGVPQLILASPQLAALQTESPNGTFEIRQRGDRGLSEPLFIPLI